MKKKPSGRMRLALGLIPEQRTYDVETNLKATLKLAHQAGRSGADLVAFEECGLCLFAPEGATVRIPGPETRALSRVARRYRMYIAAPMIARTRTGRHNAVVLFDRRGRIQTVYCKHQLTNPELMSGLLPGHEIRPIVTDFGRIGFLICYDTQFLELFRMLGVADVDLIICPHVGGAGSGGGDLLGGAAATYNHCWVAWVGRYATSVINPRGVTVARMRDTGKLLVTDIDLKRSLLPGVNNEPYLFSDLKAHQFQERRPDLYRSPAPPVVIESSQWPFYVGNPLSPGHGRVIMEIRNRSDRFQRGILRAEFPIPQSLRSDESHGFMVDRKMGPSWNPHPARIVYALPPNTKKKVRIAFTVPAQARGPYLVRVVGYSRQGERILWQRVLLRKPAPPRLAIPRLAAVAQLQERGAVMPLAHQFMGGPARARTDLRLGGIGPELVFHATCHRYGPWEEGRDLDSLSIAFEPKPGTPLIYWLTVHRDGRTTAQRREHGYIVQKPLPKWSAAVRRRRTAWSALIRIPFAGTGPMPDRHHPWRMNVQRSAPLPDALNARRFTCKVLTPETNLVAVTRTRGCEWSVWNPVYARIDCSVGFGEIFIEA